MLPIDQEQHLGYKAFFMLALRHISAGIILTIFSLGITFFGKFFSSSLVGIVSTFGGTKINSVNISSEILMILVIIIFCIGVFICFLGVLIAYFQYRNYTYRFDEFDFIMKNGILDIKETSIPYRQIQDINIERPLSYQFLGLSNLVIRTAGTEEKSEHGMTEIKIEPIDKDIADKIQSMLERKIGVQVVEDDVKADKEEKMEEK